MAHRDLVVVGASAGGVEALSRFVACLPADLPASVLVVLHLSPHSPSALPSILARSARLPVSGARSGAPLQPGVVLVGPPDHHLVLRDADTVVLTAGPHENGHRPAVDVLFRTAARFRGPRVIAVVLSGNLDDGTAGATEVRARGGRVLVQDPARALYSAMPEAVLAGPGADVTGDAAALAETVVELCGEEVPDDVPEPPPPLLRQEADVAQGDPDGFHERSAGEPSGLTCPDCLGALYTVQTAPLLRFRCRVGHAWSADSLAERQNQSVETALWTALRTLEEKADFCARLATRAIDEGRHLTAEHLHDSIRTTAKSADKIKLLLSEIHPTPVGDRDGGHARAAGDE